MKLTDDDYADVIKSAPFQALLHALSELPDDAWEHDPVDGYDGDGEDHDEEDAKCLCGGVGCNSCEPQGRGWK